MAATRWLEGLAMMLKLLLLLTFILMWTSNGCDEVVVLEEAGEAKVLLSRDCGSEEESVQEKVAQELKDALTYEFW